MQEKAYRYSLSMYKKLASFFVALFIDIPALNIVLLALLPVSGGLMIPMYLISAVAIIITSIIGEKNKSNVSPGAIFLSCIFLMFYILTISLGKRPSVNFPNFLVCTFFAFLAPQLVSFDVKYTLKWLFLLPCLGIVRLSRIFVMNSLYAETISMGLSYAFLIPIIANLVYLFCYYPSDSKGGKIITLTASLINLTYLVKLLAYGSRGPVLCFILCLGFLMCFKQKQRGGLHATPIALFFFVLVLILVANFWTILQSLSTAFESFGWNVNFIDKLIRMKEIGDATNGRGRILTEALMLIPDNILLGHGIATFYSYTGIVYPHNFLIQSLFDGGILLAGCVVTPLIGGVVKWALRCSKNDYALFTFLLFYSLPYALLSNDMWLNTMLWVTIGSLMSKKDFRT